MLIFKLFVSAGVLLEGDLSLWVSLTMPDKCCLFQDSRESPKTTEETSIKVSTIKSWNKTQTAFKDVTLKSLTYNKVQLTKQCIKNYWLPHTTFGKFTLEFSLYSITDPLLRNIITYCLLDILTQGQLAPFWHCYVGIALWFKVILCWITSTYAISLYLFLFFLSFLSLCCSN